MKNLNCVAGRIVNAKSGHHQLWTHAFYSSPQGRMFLRFSSQEPPADIQISTDKNGNWQERDGKGQKERQYNYDLLGPEHVDNMTGLRLLEVTVREAGLDMPVCKAQVAVAMLPTR